MVLKGNAVVVQAGGPTAVINNTLAGIVDTARQNREVITNLYGAMFGFGGILDEDLTDLYQQDEGTLARVARTPGAALGSARINPSDEDLDRAFDVFEAHNIRHVFYIGGDDSRKASKKLLEKAAGRSYEMGVFSVPKTIDNDLPDTDHCPGYGTAAAFACSAMAGDNEDNKSFRNSVKVNVAMGMEWSWVAAATGLARKSEEDAPHVIVFSELPFSMDAFLGNVQDAFDRYGRADIVVAESLKKQIAELNKKPSADAADGFGHAKLHTPEIAQYLVDAIESCLKVPASAGKLRARGDVWGYLQRTFPIVSVTDFTEAHLVGKYAAICAAKGRLNRAIVLRRARSPRYHCLADNVALEETSPGSRRLPDEFIGSDRISISDKFRDYAAPFVDDVLYINPREMDSLEPIAVGKKLKPYIKP